MMKRANSKTTLEDKQLEYPLATETCNCNLFPLQQNQKVNKLHTQQPYTGFVNGKHVYTRFQPYNMDQRRIKL
jgi:hypothetical protein